MAKVNRTLSSSNPPQKFAGVLLHISSLPSGDLGADAYRFVDFLASVSAAVWQVLPLNQTHDDGSPYQCLSAHAGNLSFISLQMLADMQLLQPAQLPTLARPSIAEKSVALQAAYTTFKTLPRGALHRRFSKFCKNAHWLNDYALFMLLRTQFNQAGWNTWPALYKKRDAATIKAYTAAHADALAFIKFCQFIFFEQWAKLRAYANAKGVRIFGDIPIFVAYDSADVWANPDMFRLNKRGEMTVVAGVPPDYFSANGQRWGNPHYRWSAMKKTQFSWWLSRIHTLNAMFDMLRIDHFRGLQAAWEIPAKAETAIDGKWRKAPGNALLKAISSQFPKLKLIAEDLGIITPEVDALRLKYRMPGMKILHFAFGGGEDNPYLPHNIEANSVVYTGTHDNDTTVGWYESLDEHSKTNLLRHLNTTTPNMPEDLINIAMQTVAELAIIPMQDVLAMPASCRMNTPSTLGNNWLWYFDWHALTPSRIEQLRNAITHSGRATCSA